MNPSFAFGDLEKGFAEEGLLKAEAGEKTDKRTFYTDLLIAEAGVPGYESIAWFALVGPAGLPRPIVDRLNRETAVMQKTKSVIDTFANAGAEMLPGTPEQLTAFMTADVAKWSKLVQSLGLKTE